MTYGDVQLPDESVHTPIMGNGASTTANTRAAPEIENENEITSQMKRPLPEQ